WTNDPLCVSSGANAAPPKGESCAIQSRRSAVHAPHRRRPAQGTRGSRAPADALVEPRDPIPAASVARAARRGNGVTADNMNSKQEKNGRPKRAAKLKERNSDRDTRARNGAQ